MAHNISKISLALLICIVDIAHDCPEQVFKIKDRVNLHALVACCSRRMWRMRSTLGVETAEDAEEAGRRMKK